MSNNRLAVDYSSPERLKKVLAGDFELPIKKILAEAWTETTKNIPTLLSAFLVIIGIGMILFVLFNQFVFQIDLSTPETEAGAVSVELQALSIVLQLLLAPLNAGIVLLGIRRGQGETVRAANVFDALPRALSVMGLFILVAAISMLGSGLLAAVIPILSILFVLYLQIITAAALPLLLTQNLSVLNAFYYSVLLVHKKLLEFSLLTIVVAALVAVSLLTVGIGFIWTIPFTYTLIGVVYRHLFGLRKAEVNGKIAPKNADQGDDWRA